MSYHTIISQERRASAPENPRQLATDIQGQLHSMGERIDNIDDPQIIFASSWDGSSPYVDVLKGNLADLTMAYMGWPMIDRKTWIAQDLVKL